LLLLSFEEQAAVQSRRALVQRRRGRTARTIAWIAGADRWSVTL
jgi:hypothetical protein